MLDTLDKLMTIDEALERWPNRFGREELLRACRENRLHHVPKGRLRLVSEEWLLEYLKEMEVDPWAAEGGAEKKSGSSSAGTGSGGKSQEAPSTATGMTPSEETRAAAALRQKIGKRRKASSPESS